MLEEVISDPLVDQIRGIPGSEKDDFWSFRNSSKRKGAHALLHYPAMMVPNLQGTLLDAMKRAKPGMKTVLDPFVGSGTTLVESMNRGFDFFGVDINPLATLACLAKSGPYFIELFQQKSLELTSRIHSDRSRKQFARFESQKKWMDVSASVSISRIARNIELEESKWARRLFWLALARVVRTRSNSRMSTYKLHIRKIVEDEAPRRDPILLFEATLLKFATHLEDQYIDWSRAGLIFKGRYKGHVRIVHGDSRETLANPDYSEKFDVVMTSPPYGDNTTTIPYGQYAYLPLKWIANEDLAAGVNEKIISNTHSTDTASLGGSLRNAVERGQELASNYDSAKHFLNDLSGNSSGVKRFSAFFSDLDDCVQNICDVTVRGGYQSWTIGNRRIGGLRVPMERLLHEMLAARKVSTVAHIHRTIHAKKMATRNSVSDTMSSEIVLLAKKGRELNGRKKPRRE